MNRLKKRIYINFLSLILLCALLLSASVSGVVYNAIRNGEMAAIKDRANLAADLLNNASGITGFYDFLNHGADAARVTIIAPDGAVTLDNKSKAAYLENHGDREEFIQAVQTGRGETIRYSSTLNEETYYYAIRLNDGNVLRVSKTTSRLAGVFMAVLPAIAGVAALVLIVANALARRLTRKIIDPLNSIDFDGGNANVYEELLPYIKKIDQQKSEIAKQIALLKNRADTIEVITGNMKEGLILVDKTGIILAVNKSALDVFSLEDMAGKNILHICRDTEFHAGVKACLSGIDTEILYKRENKMYNSYFSSVFDGKALNGGVIFLLDISEKHEAEKQRREFSANVSHELKTPLTTISALSEMVENGMALENDVKTFAQKISMQAKRLINIIDDIIKLSEFDEGRIIAEYTEFNLYELALSVSEVLRERASERQISVDVCGERFNVNANRQMIDELLYNLVDNAIKYNKDDGSVTITLTKGDGFYRIVVADTGIGISKEHQSRVFERFYRADKSRSKKTGGTGLGLSIVKHITEYHGGRVMLTSAADTGTKVECQLADSPASISRS